jgi:hypothetical protein
MMSGETDGVCDDRGLVVLTSLGLLDDPSWRMRENLFRSDFGLMFGKDAIFTDVNEAKSVRRAYGGSRWGRGQTNKRRLDRRIFPGLATFYVKGRAIG